MIPRRIAEVSAAVRSFTFSFRKMFLTWAWTVASTPVNSGPSGGLFAAAFHGQQHGIAVGGDLATPTASPNNFAGTHDGGSSWGLLTGAPAEYRSGVTWVDGHTVIAVGPTGSDVSYDGARRWKAFDTAQYDAVDCVDGTCWASGPAGAVAKLDR